MKKKRKVMVVTSSRADWSRCRTVCEELEKREDTELQLVVCGAHLSDLYGITVKDIEESQIPIVARLDTLGSRREDDSASMAVQYTITSSRIEQQISKFKPDVVVAVTDRFEALATATVGALMNVHVAHIQGGEISGTIDESIRHATTKLSHLHFPATIEAENRIVRMGEDPAFVFNVGCPASDLIVREQSIGVLDERFIEPGDEPYVLVLYHPVTTEYSEMKEKAEAVFEAVSLLDGVLPIILMPNHDAGHDLVRSTILGLTYGANFQMVLGWHFTHDKFSNMLKYAECLIGNSSAGIREACYFGTPVVNIGTRQRGRYPRGEGVVDVEEEAGAIYKGIRDQIQHGKYKEGRLYGGGDAGKQIAEILATIELPPIQKQLME